jgi:hypothetical protein
MSLGIAFKGPEGIVLAADSRVILQAEVTHGAEKMVLPSAFDNATKLLQIAGHKYVGAVTYGLGAIGQQEPRTAHSFLLEFEDYLSKKKIDRFPIKDFAENLANFFKEQWNGRMPSNYSGPDMVFLVGGFDAGEPYGKVFQVLIPSNIVPTEYNAGQFGITWGGQSEYTHRLIKGFDPQMPSLVQNFLKLSPEQTIELERHLENALSSPIPYQFLPLQDSVNLSILLIRTTMEIQNWIVGVRGVGGAIDVATITRKDGFIAVQQKAISGEKIIIRRAGD